MKLLFPVFAAMALAACSSKVDFEIDNPTATPLAISIDGKDLPVAPNASRPVSLAPGEHTLHTQRLGDVRFIVYVDSRGGLINPTLSEYVTAREIYVTGEDKLKNFGASGLGIEIGGVAFKGPFDKFHGLFIDKTWNFGVREPFPQEQIVAHVDSSGGKISTKIFTAPDFITYVEEGMGEPGAFKREQPAGYVAPVYTLEPAPASLPALDPAFEAHAGPLRDLYARWLKASTAAEQKALRKEDFQASMAFTQATATLGSKLPVAANQAYNDFVTIRSTEMARSAVVLP
ncbi:hypothetical protein C1925_07185 [Stenotrophomonas sp. SAU14A_NAIMI4_5]|uniref:hypothetical protein n=1 Tax=Stenotrophomonas sp. SAU14A_NAIMI4_5 TaxID=2072413 RepID=UPI000D53F7F7|nr:hypothetical protein [Stenotrophomonas sp. SAU14A_NAIMI4_5]AWH48952.1 hypothetical protein C1925_07185 [Stenotrophomonas sp. SAU14A_NAIMI4_5]